MTEAAPAAVAPELSGTPAAAGASTTELVEVTLGDKVVKVDKATAETLKAFDASVKAAGVATAGQLKAAQDQLAAAAPRAPANPAAAPDIETLIFTNPKEAVRLIKEEISAGINAQVTQTNQQQAFWSEFYSQNADLKDSDWLVKAVMAREFGNLKTLQVPEAIKKLSEFVKGDILKLAGKKPKTNQSAEIEGGNESERRRSNATDESEHSPASGGISGVIKERQKARRTAKASAAA